MVINIDSINNERIKLLYKQTRDVKNKLFVIESINVIKEQNDSLNDDDIIILTKNFFEKNKWINRNSIIIVTNKKIIEKLAFTKSPPDCIVIKKLKIKGFEIEKQTDYVILDNIKDPGNVATIIRSSIAFGINKFFISKNSVSIYNDKLLRSTMGSIFFVKVNYYDNLIDIVTKLEKNNIECIASCLDKNAIQLNKFKPKSKNHALIFGNESFGILKKDLNSLKNKVYIEISNIDSLNVACATSIFLYQKYLWDLKWKK